MLLQSLLYCAFILLWLHESLLSPIYLEYRVKNLDYGLCQPLALATCTAFKIVHAETLPRIPYEYRMLQLLPAKCSGA